MSTKGCQQLATNTRAFRSLFAFVSSSSASSSSSAMRRRSDFGVLKSSFREVQIIIVYEEDPTAPLRKDRVVVLFRRHANEKKRASLRGNPTFKRDETNQRELGTAVFCDVLKRGCDFMRRFERETGHQFRRMGERRSEEKVRKRRRREMSFLH